MKLAAILTLCVAMTACGESSFSGGSAKATNKSKSGTSGGIDGAGGGNSSGDSMNGGDGSGAGGNGNADGSGGAGGSKDPIFDGGNGAIPTDCSNEQILIIDLKSGWWAGDGGQTFQTFMRDEIEKRSCEGGVVSVEYHHILKGSKELKSGAKFYEKDFKTYTQVWLLSGSLEDDLDIRLEEANFQDLIAQIKSTKPRLFIGAGFGSSDHANELSQKVLWGQDLFKVEIKHGDILTVTSNNVTVQSYVTPLATGNLFSGLTGPIVDQVKVGGFMSGGDTIAGADEIIKLSGVTALANCVTVDNKRTVPCVGVASYGGFNMVLDSGLPRFYGIQTGHEPTKQYFRNIVRALSK